MSQGNKEIALIVRDTTGSWSMVEEINEKLGIRQPKEFRSESAAQREGSLMLKAGNIDAFKLFKLVSCHH